MRWLDSIADSMDVLLSRLQEIVKGQGSWRAAVRGSQRVRRDLATEQQQEITQFSTVMSHENRTQTSKFYSM